MCVVLVVPRTADETTKYNWRRRNFEEDKNLQLASSFILNAETIKLPCFQREMIFLEKGLIDFLRSTVENFTVWLQADEKKTSGRERKEQFRTETSSSPGRAVNSILQQ